MSQQSFSSGEIIGVCRNLGLTDRTRLGDGDFCLYFQVRGEIITIVYKTLVSNSKAIKETVTPYVSYKDTTMKFKNVTELQAILSKFV